LRIIPLLIDGATMPVRAALPNGLNGIVDINAAVIRSDPDFHRDMERLITAIGEPSGEGASSRAADLRQYRMLFDRAAFLAPCAFEGSLKHLSSAVEQVTAAMATGSLYSRDHTLLAQVSPLNEFANEQDRSALLQVRATLQGLGRPIKDLVRHLSEVDGLKVGEAEFDHIEFMLVSLIKAGASQDFVVTAFTLMDDIDAQRNCVIAVLNGLLESAFVQPLPRIPLSTEMLRTSEQIELNGGEGSQRWDLFYLREHWLLRPFVEKGRLGLPMEFLDLGRINGLDEEPWQVMERILENTDIATIEDLRCRLADASVEIQGLSRDTAQQIASFLRTRDPDSIPIRWLKGGRYRRSTNSRLLG